MDCLLRAGQIEADLQGEGKVESARVIKRRSERRLGLVGGYLELTRQREGPFFSQALPCLVSLGPRAGHVGSTLAAWGSHCGFCSTSNKPDIRPNLGEGERWSQIRLQQSQLVFNVSVIVIIFDFLIEIQ